MRRFYARDLKCVLFPPLFSANKTLLGGGGGKPFLIYIHVILFHLFAFASYSQSVGSVRRRRARTAECDEREASWGERKRERERQTDRDREAWRWDKLAGGEPEQKVRISKGAWGKKLREREEGIWEREDRSEREREREYQKQERGKYRMREPEREILCRWDMLGCRRPGISLLCLWWLSGSGEHRPPIWGVWEKRSSPAPNTPPSHTNKRGALSLTPPLVAAEQAWWEASEKENSSSTQGSNYPLSLIARLGRPLMASHTVNVQACATLKVHWSQQSVHPSVFSYLSCLFMWWLSSTNLVCQRWFFKLIGWYQSQENPKNVHLLSEKMIRRGICGSRFCFCRFRPEVRLITDGTLCSLLCSALQTPKCYHIRFTVHWLLIYTVSVKVNGPLFWKPKLGENRPILPRRIVLHSSNK